MGPVMFQIAARTAFIAVAGAAIYGLDLYYGPLSWVTVVATIGGVGGSILLAAALMGLVFLSSGTGHDEAVDARD